MLPLQQRSVAKTRFI
ncbi:UNVERIFIED_CONTAM: hypothetical protein GTU68_029492 [Idotea baltica]|nr:hypothetical protein [Idotea baltica]